jgi:hypothetical protein
MPGVAFVATETTAEMKFNPEPKGLAKKLGAPIVIPLPEMAKVAPLVGKLGEATPMVMLFCPGRNVVGKLAHE